MQALPSSQESAVCVHAPVTGWQASSVQGSASAQAFGRVSQAPVTGLQAPAWQAPGPSGQAFAAGRHSPPVSTMQVPLDRGKTQERSSATH